MLIKAEENMIEFMIGLLVGWICGIIFSAGVFLRKGRWQ